MSEKFFAIGHITNDVEPQPHMGGGVTYTAVGLHNLGYEAHIITKIPPHHPYITDLENMGITVHTVPISLNVEAGVMTSFRNFYDTSGHREQIVPTVQETIAEGDLQFFPDMPENSIVLIAPVISEVDPSLIPILSEKHHVVVTPQGYFRERQADGRIRRVPWERVDTLSSADVAIFSDEDITENGTFNDALLQRMRNTIPLAIMTQGSEGATVLEGNEIKKLHTFTLTDEELKQGDFTGAGDTFAAGFIASYYQTHNAGEATAFGMLFAALKIAGIGEGGIGITTVPTLEQIRSFAQSHSPRVQAYLQANNMTSLEILK